MIIKYELYLNKKSCYNEKKNNNNLYVEMLVTY